MSIYLDASVLVAMLGAEDGTPAALAFTNDTKAPLFVSDFAVGELSSAISRLVRMGNIDLGEGQEKLAAFDEWAANASQPLATTENDIRSATQLVRRFALGIRMPDAIHIASARIRGLTLVTLDQRMAMATEQLGMEVIDLN